VQVYKEAKDVFDDVQGKINAAQNDYNRIAPKATKAYKTVKGLMSRDSKEWKKLQKELKYNLAEEIKPAAERLAKTVLIDIQDDVLEKFDEISSHADEFMYIARNEYQKTTNSIPDSISEAIEQTLIKTINERDAKMREMFPKLTKEKQAKVVARLSSFSKKESEKIFIALFADHFSEFGKMQDSMNKIYTKEAEAGAIASNKSSVGTTLALLSSLIEIAMREFDDLDHSSKTPEKDPKAEDPESKDKPTSPAKDAETLVKEKRPEPEKKKAESKKKDPSLDNQ
jgi:hypothetical protein